MYIIQEPRGHVLLGARAHIPYANNLAFASQTPSDDRQHSRNWFLMPLRNKIRALLYIVCLSRGSVYRLYLQENRWARVDLLNDARY